MKNDIFIIEDDPVLGKTLKDYLECNGLSVYWSKTGEEAITEFKKSHPQLIISDVILPGVNGYEVIAEIRKLNSTIPVIVMSGTEHEPASQIKAYQLGALNFIKKPVYPDVLLAQIKNIIAPSTKKRIQQGTHVFEIQNQILTIDHREFQLREKDVQVFEYLLEHLNDVVIREDLMEFWADYEHTKRNNSLDATISRLKKTLKIYPDINIESIYGSGYRFTIE